MGVGIYNIETMYPKLCNILTYLPHIFSTMINTQIMKENRVARLRNLLIAVPTVVALACSGTGGGKDAGIKPTPTPKPGNGYCFLNVSDALYWMTQGSIQFHCPNPEVDNPNTEVAVEIDRIGNDARIVVFQSHVESQEIWIAYARGNATIPVPKDKSCKDIVVLVTGATPVVKQECT